MKKIYAFLILALFAIIKTSGQNVGDFQSVSGTTNWSSYTSWQIWNGSAWIAATSGQLPTSTSAVTIVSGNSMTIDLDAAPCGNLTIIGTLTRGSISTFNLTGNITMHGGTFNLNNLTFILNRNLTITVDSNSTYTNYTTGAWTINGNLSINGSATLSLNGILQVNGNLTINNTCVPGSGFQYVFYGGNYYSGVSGNLTINGSFKLNGYNFNVGGNLNNPGTFDASTGNLNFNGITQQIITGTGTFTNSTILNLTINNTSVATPGVDLQVNNLSVSSSISLTNGSFGTSNSSSLTLGKSTSSTTLSVNRGDGSFASSFVPGTNLIYNLSGVTTFNVQYNSATLPKHNITTGIELPASVQVSTLTINTLSNIILDKPVSSTSMTMYTGILTTSSTNLLTITGTSTGSIFVSSIQSYVAGPLALTIPSGLTGGSNNYKFPVGKTKHCQFEFANINTTGTGNAIITVEVFDAGGPFAGTAGTGLGSVATDKYWSMIANMGSVTITSSTIRLNDSNLVSTNKVAQSNTLTGTYNTLGGSFVTSQVTSYKAVDYSTISTGTFFRIGTIGGTFPAGKYAIGPNGPYVGYLATYTTFQNAINAMADIPGNGNVIFEFQSDYLPTVETYPITASHLSGSSTSTITFRPAASDTAIHFTNSSITLAFSGCSYVILDGRPGGSGTNKYLLFNSTGTANQTIDINSDASYNQILYSVLSGSVTSASYGILQFTAGSVTGNNNNIIDHCNFNSVVSNCIYAIGAYSANNSNVTISNNNFYNFKGASASAINLQNYNNAWTINGNSFYQTTAVTGVAGTTYCIYTYNVENGQFLIFNNYLGGSGPGCTGTWTSTSSTTISSNFTGMYLNLSTTATSKIYNNRISNFSWTSKPTATWIGIYGIGNVNIGTDGSNIIGGNSGTGSITVTYNAAGSANVYGIKAGSGNIRIENNFIGSITTATTSLTTIGGSITAIYAGGTNTLINKNSIGSTITAKSINASIGTTSSAIQSVMGINNASSGIVTISGDTIANLYNSMVYSNASYGMCRGILITAGTTVVADSNLIYTLTSPQPMSGTTTSANIVGMDIEPTSATSTTVTGNIIYDLVNTYSTASAINVIGIFANLSTTGTNKIDRNFIHSFNTVSSSAVQIGFFLYSGICTFQNNVIRLGLDKTGTSITSTATIYGIYYGYSGTPTGNFYFNTIYIGGTGVTTGASTYGFYMGTHNIEDIRNNIFANVRANSSGAANNYAISYFTSTSGFTSDYNIYYVNSTYGKLSPSYLSMSALILLGSTGCELHSGFGNPLLLNPTTALTTSTINLSLNTNSPAEGYGIAISGITVDIAGNSRSNADIGAYANIVAPPGIGQDIFYPVITFNLLTNSALTTTRPLTGFATITDELSGVRTVTGSKPRLYYRNKTDANAFVGNLQTNNGWKYVEASNYTSPFSFTINYAILNHAAASGSQINYFVVAQDSAAVPNLSFNPPVGGVGTNVATITKAPYYQDSFKIVSTNSNLTSPITVGTGHHFTNLTGSTNTGLFKAINNGILYGNTIVIIASDSTESGATALNALAYDGVTPYHLIIKSNGSAQTITGATTQPLISFNGASGVTIDGSSSKLLTIRNTYSTAASTGSVISYSNGAISDSINNCYIESNLSSTSTGCILLGAAPANIVTVYNCDIRDAHAGTTGSPAVAIYSYTAGNALNCINSNIYNWTAYGIYINTPGNGCILTGNSFYMTNSPTAIQTALYLVGGSGHTISGNFVGGQAANCGGSALTYPIAPYGSFTAFVIQPGTVSNTTISGNTISNITINGSSNSFTGFSLSGMFNFTGNTVGSATIANSITCNFYGSIIGVSATSSSATNNFEQNIFANISQPAIGYSSFSGMSLDNGNVRKNKIYNINLTGGSGYGLGLYGIVSNSGTGAREYSNNMVSLGTTTNTGSSNTIYGIQDNSSASSMNLYYNSVYIYGTASYYPSSAVPLYLSSNHPYTIENNLLAMAQACPTCSNFSYALYISSSNTSTIISDYNDLYVVGPYYKYKYNYITNLPSNNDTSLAMWQSSGHDLHSKSTLPNFNSTSDLHITSDTNIANQGTAVSVIVDIDGKARCTYPDLGINQFSPCITYKTLNLTVFLESLDSGIVMRKARNATGFQFPGTTADQITVEFHNSTTYATIVTTFTNVNLSTTGTATINVPVNYNGIYYVTIVPRNSIATVSATPISFGQNTINYNFSNAATKAYGSNEKLLSTGLYGIYAGDVNGDGAIDGLDLIAVENAADLFTTGYVLTDVNGDGVVDGFDLIMIENNVLNFVAAIHP